jgi:hypothetical protein
MALVLVAMLGVLRVKGLDDEHGTSKGRGA